MPDLPFNIPADQHWQAPQQMLYQVYHILMLQAGKYAWVETWSEEHNRPYYYDQANHISTWDKPADLAWRRVYLPDEPESNAQPETAADSTLA